MQSLEAEIHQAILEGEEELAAQIAERALEQGREPLDFVENGCVPAIREAGELFDEGEYFLPELVTAAQAMKAAMAVLEKEVGASDSGRARRRAVIGTVAGDIHDIGKTLVGTLLSANGFEVFDEGVGVTVERFVERARELDANMICASALLTTTMVEQRQLVEAVRKAGLEVKVMVGGAPVRQSWADEIGADGYAESAVAAVSVARQLLADAEL
ncbi:MAG: dimethylamine corrinoid protein 3 [bacterium]|nr:dimethylamine corrinoid protein 3 [bacterium]